VRILENHEGLENEHFSACWEALKMNRENSYRRGILDFVLIYYKTLYLPLKWMRVANSSFFALFWIKI
jgi:hypothetical protein